MLWLFYILVQILVWNVPIRDALFPMNPLVHLMANGLNDLIWLPLAVALPVYIFQLIARIGSRLVLRHVLQFLFILLMMVLIIDASFYFRLMFVLIALFFILWGISIWQNRVIHLKLLFFSAALCAMIFHYQLQLLPKTARASSYLTVMSFNIDTRMATYDAERTIQLLRTHVPDIVFLQECRHGAEIKNILAKLQDIYPYYLLPGPYSGTADVLILSRLPILRAENFVLKADSTKTGRLVNHAVIEYQNQQVHLINCHLTHPVKYFEKWIESASYGSRWSDLREAYRQQQEEAHRFVDFVETLQGPVIVAGDFNQPPNSDIYRRMTRNLQNAFARAGWGVGVTYGKWTMQQKLPLFLQNLAFDYLRIDHIFYSRHFRILDARVLPLGAFDHRPQTAKLQLQP
jgi:vancomycin resistance protein VanJ